MTALPNGKQPQKGKHNIERNTNKNKNAKGKIKKKYF